MSLYISCGVNGHSLRRQRLQLVTNASRTGSYHSAVGQSLIPQRSNAPFGVPAKVASTGFRQTPQQRAVGFHAHSVAGEVCDQDDLPVQQRSGSYASAIPATIWRTPFHIDLQLYES